MPDIMTFFNEQEQLKDPNPVLMVHESDGSYSWSGETGGKGTSEWYFYNLRYLKRGATYRMSYTARTTRTDNQRTTSIQVYNGTTEYIAGEYVSSNQWQDYSYTFSVADEFNIYLTFGWDYDTRTYFQNIRLECVDQDDFEKEITSSTTLDIESDHTLYAKWSQYTWDDYAASSYSSGSGTAVSPYIIKTAPQLAKLALDSRTSNLSGVHFKLGSDLDMGEHYFASIGSADYRFSGTFDGAMHRIYHINTSFENSNGLFNKSNGEIRNLILSNSTFNIAAVGDGGGIVGEMRGGIIENCIVDGVNIIAPQTEYVAALGTLVGGKSSGTIKNCISKDSSIFDGRTCVAYVGGLIGWMDGGTIDNCAIYGGQVITPNRSDAAPFICFRHGGVISVYYAQVNVITKSKSSLEKVIYGDSNLWDGFFYNEQINDGYPIPKTLVSLGSIDVSSATIYNALINKGFKTA